jgi:hypothetical protein
MGNDVNPYVAPVRNVSSLYNSEEDYILTPVNSAVENHPFVSRFAAWMRAVALIIICVFIPDQISWAINYNPSILWGAKVQAPVQPAALTPAQKSAVLIAGSVDRLLTEVNHQKADRLALQLETPKADARALTIQNLAKFTPAQIVAIAQWLAQPNLNVLNCGVYALQDILAANGIDQKIEDLAVLTVTSDLLSNVIRAGEPQLKVSLQAISHTAAAFGLDYGAARLAPADALKLPVPFIAHFKDEHFVTVTRVSETEVFFNDIGKPSQMRQDAFISRLSGFALVNDLRLFFRADYERVSDTSLRFIWGNKWRDRSKDLPGLMTMGQMLTDVGMQLAMTVATAGMGAWLGSLAQAAQTAQQISELTRLLLKIAEFLHMTSSFAQALSAGIVAMSISKLVGTVAQACVLSGTCSEGGAAVLSFALSTALSLGVSGMQSGVKAAVADGLKNGIQQTAGDLAMAAVKGFGQGIVEGAAVGLVQASLSYAVQKGITEAIDCNNDSRGCQVMAQMLASTVGSIAASAGVYATAIAVDTAVGSTFLHDQLGIPRDVKAAVNQFLSRSAADFGGQVAGAMAQYLVGGDPDSLVSKSVRMSVAGLVSYGVNYRMTGAGTRAMAGEDLSSEIGRRLIAGVMQAVMAVAYDSLRRTVIGADDGSARYTYRKAQYDTMAGTTLVLASGLVLGVLGKNDVDQARQRTTGAQPPATPEEAAREQANAKERHVRLSATNDIENMSPATAQALAERGTEEIPTAMFNQAQMGFNIVHGFNYVERGRDGNEFRFNNPADLALFSEHLSGMGGFTISAAIATENAQARAKKDNALLPKNQRVSDEMLDLQNRLYSVDRHRLAGVNYTSEKYALAGQQAMNNLVKTGVTYGINQNIAAQTVGSLSIILQEDDRRVRTGVKTGEGQRFNTTYYNKDLDTGLVQFIDTRHAPGEDSSRTAPPLTIDQLERPAANEALEAVEARAVNKATEAVENGGALLLKPEEDQVAAQMAAVAAHGGDAQVTYRAGGHQVTLNQTVDKARDAYGQVIKVNGDASVVLNEQKAPVTRTSLNDVWTSGGVTHQFLMAGSNLLSVRRLDPVSGKVGLVDITDENRAELKAAVEESSGFTAWLKDGVYRQSGMNPYGYRLGGRSNAELLGDPFGLVTGNDSLWHDDPAAFRVLDGQADRQVPPTLEDLSRSRVQISATDSTGKAVNITVETGTQGGLMQSTVQASGLRTITGDADQVRRQLQASLQPQKAANLAAPLGKAGVEVQDMADRLQILSRHGGVSSVSQVEEFRAADGSDVMTQVLEHRAGDFTGGAAVFDRNGEQSAVFLITGVNTRAGSFLGGQMLPVTGILPTYQFEGVSLYAGRRDLTTVLTHGINQWTPFSAPPPGMGPGKLPPVPFEGETNAVHGVVAPGQEAWGYGTANITRRVDAQGKVSFENGFRFDRDIMAVTGAVKGLQGSYVDFNAASGIMTTLATTDSQGKPLPQLMDMQTYRFRPGAVGRKTVSGGTLSLGAYAPAVYGMDYSTPKKPGTGSVLPKLNGLKSTRGLGASGVVAPTTPGEGGVSAWARVVAQDVQGRGSIGRIGRDYRPGEGHTAGISLTGDSRTGVQVAANGLRVGADGGMAVYTGENGTAVYISPKRDGKFYEVSNPLFSVTAGKYFDASLANVVQIGPNGTRVPLTVAPGVHNNRHGVTTFDVVGSGNGTFIMPTILNPKVAADPKDKEKKGRRKGDGVKPVVGISGTASRVSFGAKDMYTRLGRMVDASGRPISDYGIVANVKVGEGSGNTPRLTFNAFTNSLAAQNAWDIAYGFNLGGKGSDPGVILSQTKNGSGELLHKGYVYFDDNGKMHVQAGAAVTQVGVYKNGAFKATHGVMKPDGHLKVEWARTNFVPPPPRMVLRRVPGVKGKGRSPVKIGVINQIVSCGKGGRPCPKVSRNSVRPENAGVMSLKELSEAYGGGMLGVPKSNFVSEMVDRVVGKKQDLRPKSHQDADTKAPSRAYARRVTEKKVVRLKVLLEESKSETRTVLISSQVKPVLQRLYEGTVRNERNRVMTDAQMTAAPADPFHLKGRIEAVNGVLSGLVPAHSGEGIPLAPAMVAMVMDSRNDAWLGKGYSGGYGESLPQLRQKMLAARSPQERAWIYLNSSFGHHVRNQEGGIQAYVNQRLPHAAQFVNPNVVSLVLTPGTTLRVVDQVQPVAQYKTVGQGVPIASEVQVVPGLMTNNQTIARQGVFVLGDAGWAPQGGAVVTQRSLTQEFLPANVMPFQGGAMPGVSRLNNARMNGETYKLTNDGARLGLVLEQQTQNVPLGLAIRSVEYANLIGLSKTVMQAVISAGGAVAYDDRQRFFQESSSGAGDWHTLLPDSANPVVVEGEIRQYAPGRLGVGTPSQVNISNIVLNRQGGAGSPAYIADATAIAKGSATNSGYVLGTMPDIRLDGGNGPASAFQGPGPGSTVARVTGNALQDNLTRFNIAPEQVMDKDGQGHASQLAFSLGYRDAQGMPQLGNVHLALNDGSLLQNAAGPKSTGVPITTRTQTGETTARYNSDAGAYSGWTVQNGQSAGYKSVLYLGDSTRVRDIMLNRQMTFQERSSEAFKKTNTSHLLSLAKNGVEFLADRATAGVGSTLAFLINNPELSIPRFFFYEALTGTGMKAVVANYAADNLAESRVGRLLSNYGGVVTSKISDITGSSVQNQDVCSGIFCSASKNLWGYAPDKLDGRLQVWRKDPGEEAFGRPTLVHVTWKKADGTMGTTMMEASQASGLAHELMRENDPSVAQIGRSLAAEARTVYLRNSELVPEIASRVAANAAVIAGLGTAGAALLNGGKVGVFEFIAANKKSAVGWGGLSGAVSGVQEYRQYSTGGKELTAGNLARSVGTVVGSMATGAAQGVAFNAMKLPGAAWAARHPVTATIASATIMGGGYLGATSLSQGSLTGNDLYTAAAFAAAPIVARFAVKMKMNPVLTAGVTTGLLNVGVRAAERSWSGNNQPLTVKQGAFDFSTGALWGAGARKLGLDASFAGKVISAGVGNTALGYASDVFRTGQSSPDVAWGAFRLGSGVAGALALETTIARSWGNRMWSGDGVGAASKLESSFTGTMKPLTPLYMAAGTGSAVGVAALGVYATDGSLDGRDYQRAFRLATLAGAGMYLGLRSAPAEAAPAIKTAEQSMFQIAKRSALPAMGWGAGAAAWSVADDMIGEKSFNLNNVDRGKALSLAGLAVTARVLIPQANRITEGWATRFPKNGMGVEDIRYTWRMAGLQAAATGSGFAAISMVNDHYIKGQAINSSEAIKYFMVGAFAGGLHRVWNGQAQSLWASRFGLGVKDSVMSWQGLAKDPLLLARHTLSAAPGFALMMPGFGAASIAADALVAKDWKKGFSRGYGEFKPENQSLVQAMLTQYKSGLAMAFKVTPIMGLIQMPAVFRNSISKEGFSNKAWALSDLYNAGMSSTAMHGTAATVVKLAAARALVTEGLSGSSFFQDKYGAQAEQQWKNASMRSVNGKAYGNFNDFKTAYIEHAAEGIGQEVAFYALALNPQRSAIPSKANLDGLAERLNVDAVKDKIGRVFTEMKNADPKSKGEKAAELVELVNQLGGLTTRDISSEQQKALVASRYLDRTKAKEISLGASDGVSGKSRPEAGSFSEGLVQRSMEKGVSDLTLDERIVLAKALKNIPRDQNYDGKSTYGSIEINNKNSMVSAAQSIVENRTEFGSDGKLKLKEGLTSSEKVEFNTAAKVVLRSSAKEDIQQGIAETQRKLDRVELEIPQSRLISTLVKVGLDKLDKVEASPEFKARLAEQAKAEQIKAERAKANPDETVVEAPEVATDRQKLEMRLSQEKRLEGEKGLLIENLQRLQQSLKEVNALPELIQPIAKEASEQARSSRSSGDFEGKIFSMKLAKSTDDATWDRDGNLYINQDLLTAWRKAEAGPEKQRLERRINFAKDYYSARAQAEAELMQGKTSTLSEAQENKVTARFYEILGRRSAGIETKGSSHTPEELVRIGKGEEVRLFDERSGFASSLARQEQAVRNGGSDKRIAQARVGIEAIQAARQAQRQWLLYRQGDQREYDNAAGDRKQVLLERKAAEQNRLRVIIARDKPSVNETQKKELSDVLSRNNVSEIALHAERLSLEAQIAKENGKSVGKEILPESRAETLKQNQRIVELLISNFDAKKDQAAVSSLDFKGDLDNTFALVGRFRSMKGMPDHLVAALKNVQGMMDDARAGKLLINVRGQETLEPGQRELAVKADPRRSDVQEIIAKLRNVDGGSDLGDKISALSEGLEILAMSNKIEEVKRAVDALTELKLLGNGEIFEQGLSKAQGSGKLRNLGGVDIAKDLSKIINSSSLAPMDKKTLLLDAVSRVNRYVTEKMTVEARNKDGRDAVNGPNDVLLKSAQERLIVSMALQLKQETSESMRKRLGFEIENLLQDRFESEMKGEGRSPGEAAKSGKASRYDSTMAALDKILKDSPEGKRALIATKALEIFTKTDSSLYTTDSRLYTSENEKESHMVSENPAKLREQVKALDKAVLDLQNLKKDSADVPEIDLHTGQLKRDLAFRQSILLEDQPQGGTWKARVLDAAQKMFIGDRAVVQLRGEARKLFEGVAGSDAASPAVKEQARMHLRELAADPFQKSLNSAEGIDQTIDVMKGLVRSTGDFHDELRMYEIQRDISRELRSGQSPAQKLEKINALEQELQRLRPSLSFFDKRDVLLSVLKQAKAAQDILVKGEGVSKEVDALERANDIPLKANEPLTQRAKGIIEHIADRMTNTKTGLFNDRLVDIQREQSLIREAALTSQTLRYEIQDKHQSFVQQMINAKDGQDVTIKEDGLTQAQLRHQKFVKENYPDIFKAVNAKFEEKLLNDSSGKAIPENYSTKKEYMLYQIFFLMEMMDRLKANPSGAWGMDALVISLAMSGGKTVMEGFLAPMMNKYAAENDMVLSLIKADESQADLAAGKGPQFERYRSNSAPEESKRGTYVDRKDGVEKDLPRIRVYSTKEYQGSALDIKKSGSVEKKNSHAVEIALIDEIHEVFGTVPMITSDPRSASQILRNSGMAGYRQYERQQQAMVTAAGAIDQLLKDMTSSKSSREKALAALLGNENRLSEAKDFVVKDDVLKYEKGGGTLTLSEALKESFISKMGKDRLAAAEITGRWDYFMDALAHVLNNERHHNDVRVEHNNGAFDLVLMNTKGESAYDRVLTDGKLNALMRWHIALDEAKTGKLIPLDEYVRLTESSNHTQITMPEALGLIGGWVGYTGTADPIRSVAGTMGVKEHNVGRDIKIGMTKWDVEVYSGKDLDKMKGEAQNWIANGKGRTILLLNQKNSEICTEVAKVLNNLNADVIVKQMNTTNAQQIVKELSDGSVDGQGLRGRRVILIGPMQEGASFELMGSSLTHYDFNVRSLSETEQAIMRGDALLPGMGSVHRIKADYKVFVNVDTEGGTWDHRLTKAQAGRLKAIADKDAQKRASENMLSEPKKEEVAAVEKGETDSKPNQPDLKPGPPASLELKQAYEQIIRDLEFQKTSEHLSQSVAVVTRMNREDLGNFMERQRHDFMADLADRFADKNGLARLYVGVPGDGFQVVKRSESAARYVPLVTVAMEHGNGLQQYGQTYLQPGYFMVEGLNGASAQVFPVTKLPAYLESADKGTFNVTTDRQLVRGHMINPEPSPDKPAVVPVWVPAQQVNVDGKVYWQVTETLPVMNANYLQSAEPLSMPAASTVPIIRQFEGDGLQATRNYVRLVNTREIRTALNMGADDQIFLSKVESTAQRHQYQIVYDSEKPDTANIRGVLFEGVLFRDLVKSGFKEQILRKSAAQSFEAVVSQKVVLENLRHEDINLKMTLRVNNGVVELDKAEVANSAPILLSGGNIKKGDAVSVYTDSDGGNILVFHAAGAMAVNGRLYQRSEQDLKDGTISVDRAGIRLSYVRGGLKRTVHALGRETWNWASFDKGYQRGKVELRAGMPEELKGAVINYATGDITSSDGRMAGILVNDSIYQRAPDRASYVIAADDPIVDKIKAAPMLKSQLTSDTQGGFKVNAPGFEKAMREDNVFIEKIQRGYKEIVATAGANFDLAQQMRDGVNSSPVSPAKVEIVGYTQNNGGDWVRINGGQPITSAVKGGVKYGLLLRPSVEKSPFADMIHFIKSEFNNDVVLFPGLDESNSAALSTNEDLRLGANLGISLLKWMTDSSEAGVALHEIATHVYKKKLVALGKAGMFDQARVHNMNIGKTIRNLLPGIYTEQFSAEELVAHYFEVFGLDFDAHNNPVVPDFLKDVLGDDFTSFARRARQNLPGFFFKGKMAMMRESYAQAQRAMQDGLAGAEQEMRSARQQAKAMQDMFNRMSAMGLQADFVFRAAARQSYQALAKAVQPVKNAQDIEKSSLADIKDIERTELDPNNAAGVWENVAGTNRVRLKAGYVDKDESFFAVKLSNGILPSALREALTLARNNGQKLEIEVKVGQGKSEERVKLEQYIPEQALVSGVVDIDKLRAMLEASAQKARDLALRYAAYEVMIEQAPFNADEWARVEKGDPQGLNVAWSKIGGGRAERAIRSFLGRTGTGSWASLNVKSGSKTASSTYVPPPVELNFLKPSFMAQQMSHIFYGASGVNVAAASGSSATDDDQGHGYDAAMTVPDQRAGVMPQQLAVTIVSGEQNVRPQYRRAGRALRAPPGAGRLSRHLELKVTDLPAYHEFQQILNTLRNFPLSAPFSSVARARLTYEIGAGNRLRVGNFPDDLQKIEPVRALFAAQQIEFSETDITAQATPRGERTTVLAMRQVINDTSAMMRRLKADGIDRALNLRTAVQVMHYGRAMALALRWTAYEGNVAQIEADVDDLQTADSARMNSADFRDVIARARTAGTLVDIEAGDASERDLRGATDDPGSCVRTSLEGAGKGNVEKSKKFYKKNSDGEYDLWHQYYIEKMQELVDNGVTRSKLDALDFIAISVYKIPYTAPEPDVTSAMVKIMARFTAEITAQSVADRILNFVDWSDIGQVSRMRAALVSIIGQKMYDDALKLTKGYKGEFRAFRITKVSRGVVLQTALRYVELDKARPAKFRHTPEQIKAWMDNWAPAYIFEYRADAGEVWFLGSKLDRAEYELTPEAMQILELRAKIKKMAKRFASRKPGVDGRALTRQQFENAVNLYNRQIEQIQMSMQSPAALAEAKEYAAKVAAMDQAADPVPAIPLTTMAAAAVPAPVIDIRVPGEREKVDLLPENERGILPAQDNAAAVSELPDPSTSTSVPARLVNLFMWPINVFRDHQPKNGPRSPASMTADALSRAVDNARDLVERRKAEFTFRGWTPVPPPKPEEPTKDPSQLPRTPMFPSGSAVPTVPPPAPAPVNPPMPLPGSPDGASPKPSGNGLPPGKTSDPTSLS